MLLYTAEGQMGIGGHCRPCKLLHFPPWAEMLLFIVDSLHKDQGGLSTWSAPAHLFKHRCLVLVLPSCQGGPGAQGLGARGHRHGARVPHHPLWLIDPPRQLGPPGPLLLPQL